MSKLKDTQALIWIKRRNRQMFAIILQHLRNENVLTSALGTKHFLLKRVCVAKL